MSEIHYLSLMEKAVKNAETFLAYEAKPTEESMARLRLVASTLCGAELRIWCVWHPLHRHGSINIDEQLHIYEPKHSAALPVGLWSTGAHRRRHKWLWCAGMESAGSTYWTRMYSAMMVP